MTTHELLRLRLDEQRTAASLRHLGRRAAELLDLHDLDATRIATSVSEVARVAEGRDDAELCLVLRLAGGGAAHSVFGVVFRFPGAAAAVAADPALHRSLQRLTDELQLAGDVVELRKQLDRRVDGPQAELVRDGLLRESTADSQTLVRNMNRELVDTLTTLRERETELMALNEELEQTNRGVVALYAELERRSNEVRVAQRKVFEELGDALRPPPPDCELDLDVRYVPAQANSPTGGDLYDWFVLADGSVHVTIVDVQGHGVTGTRDALRVTHTVRALSQEGHTVAELLQRSDHILQSGSVEVVATVLVARIDLSARTVQLAGAGHPPALLLHDGGGVDFVEARGRPLGYDRAGSVAVTTAPFGPGDTLLLYSDALIEQRRDVIEGMGTLREAAVAARGFSLGGLLDATIEACAGGESFRDDATLLGVRRPLGR